MLVSLARYHKPIAWFFTGLFYLELVCMSVTVRAAVHRPALNLRMQVAAADQPILDREEDVRSLSKDGTPSPAPEKATAFKNRSAAPGEKKQPFTTGPTQPEMQSFQSVNASNMVDLFTGDFSYNIPLLDVGGYPVNLHYSSGITMDQEASWVGLGWNINPGTVTRNMRGLPDDFQGGKDAVTKTVSIKPNKTIGVTIGGNIELLGKNQFSKVQGKPDSVKGRPGSVGISLGVFHNTYKGWGTETGLNVSINSGLGGAGSMTSALSITNNSQSGLDVSPSFGFHLGKGDSKTRGDITIGTNYNSRVGIQELQITGQVKQHVTSYHNQNYSIGAAVPSYISFSKPSYTPTIAMPYTSAQGSFTAKVGSENWGLHPNGYVRGYASVQKIEDKDKSLTIPAYGYLYYEKGGSNKHVLLDFNREKDVAFNQETPHIALPIYTYDTYSISGEGTGGMFRPYRGDIGFVHDHTMATKSNSNRLSVDIGLGTIVHGGVDFINSSSTTTTGPWLAENQLKEVIGFRQQDTTFENVYFKNPGEKTVVNTGFLNSIGGDSLVRVDLSPLNGQNLPSFFATRNLSVFHNSRLARKINLTNNTVRRERDKRTQVISYLTALEATKAGLDTFIRSYPVNVFPGISCSNNYATIKRIGDERQAHHLSELTVLNGDGRRYVYGIPVYNKEQVEVTMSTNKEKGNAATGQVAYTDEDNSVNNIQGKDGYYNREKMPAYAHSFLLSAILSTDYADLTGDGVSEDDNGEAVKFNYSQVYNTDAAYRWRAPYQRYQATYNEGLKTDNRDEKGSFTYGERDVWYLNSIESKTMIATFVLETDSIRQDGYGVLDEDGGQNNAQRLYRLKQINLYTKADYLKNGNAAKPVKSVHFGYSYELCTKNPGSLNDTGKLTLKKVWFTYNKNNKGKANPYVFTYHSKNPEYKNGHTDRWGNYKDPARNPGNGTPLTNADFAYTLQNGTNWNTDSAAANAAPWTLTEVKLPSGGKIKVNYESDDYAYVQNKRAMQFFSIVGFANSATGTPVPQLHQKVSPYGDYLYVFAQVSEPVDNPAEIRQKYLDGVQQLFFKLAVTVPADTWGGGYEFVPCYAEIDNYGVRANSGNKTIWIKVKPIAGGYSPMATAAVQFLRLNLGSKAYRYSEPGDNFSFKNVLGMLASAGSNIASSVSGFPKHARQENKINNVVLDRSFVRLNNPVYKKLGGGLRVKRVEIKDNWYNMTAQQQVESVYGQDYTYTTTLNINGTPTTISSGVATYEPTIGGDENPFHVPHKVYVDKAGALAPVDYLYTEEPFAETFFPAPMIGYSKVKVQTIHKTKKSANGFDITEFHTAKDFPTLVEFTPIDDESKKTFSPPIANAFKFNARNHVTLSQGFKVELNDMHGKLKSQSSFAQTDTIRPISYTYNYYKLDNNTALQPRLSNKVSVIDSANGMVRHNAEIGKEVELMIDLREQISVTDGVNLEANVDFVHPFPPIVWFPMIPLPTRETNQYRSVAVLKVVNRYAILDSVLHMEKGSRVTTRDLVYDSETGQALLNQTNNEFDDPVYNFSYPAHWAYSGMSPAYKNIGATLGRLTVKQGLMYNADGSLFDGASYFESGDELLVLARDKRNTAITDSCSPLFYTYHDILDYNRVWAIDGSKGNMPQRGMFLMDSAGSPYSGEISNLKIIRSGKRNMAATPLGAVNMLANPIKQINGQDWILIDSTTEVITANAARFKDLWKIDNVWKEYDSCVMELGPRLTKNMELRTVLLREHNNGYGLIRHYTDYSANMLVASMQQYEKNQFRTRGLINIADLSQLRPGSVINSATMHFFGKIPKTLWHHGPWTNAGFNYSYDGLVQQDGVNERAEARVFRYPNPVAWGAEIPWVNEASLNSAGATHSILQYRGNKQSCEDYKDINVTAVIQSLIGLPAEYQNLVLKLDTEVPVGGRRGIRFISVLGDKYEANSSPGKCGYNPCKNPCPVRLEIEYQEQEKRCYKVCRSEVLNKTTLNPYRYGILGNWRVDTAFTYYNARKQSDVAVSTNIRTDGAIKGFIPFWTLASGFMKPAPDSTRWVWNSKITLVNGKGAEMENKDPLGRYNAGLYGYNKTLPIAVAQNSRHREITFDGFEDRDYKTSPCANCDDNGWIKLDGISRSENTSHSGRYSARLNGNSNAVTKVPVVTPESDTASTRINLRLDSIPLVTQSVVPKGQGLLTQYGITFAWPQFGINACVGHRVSSSNIEWVPQTAVTVPNQYWAAGTGPSQVCVKQNYAVRWTGKLQAQVTGVYRFTLRYDDDILFKINGVTMHAYNGEARPDIPRDAGSMSLIAGQLYDIEVLLKNRAAHGFVDLRWQWSYVMQPVPIPASNLYQNEAEANGSIINDTTWCVKFRTPAPVNAIHQKFSPLQGSKMVFSSWVKEETPCVDGSSYQSGRVRLTFNNGSAVTYTLKPKGNIIEGWQRIEEVVDIPANVTEMNVYLETANSTAAYFDDLRMHPFNSNMKSFVYDPVNLRLTAELDENNHATFYEYDDEGTLIRVKKETERGIKTIRETRSALQKTTN